MLHPTDVVAGNRIHIADRGRPGLSTVDTLGNLVDSFGREGAGARAQLIDGCPVSRFRCLKNRTGPCTHLLNRALYFEPWQRTMADPVLGMPVAQNPSIPFEVAVFRAARTQEL